MLVNIFTRIGISLSRRWSTWKYSFLLGKMGTGSVICSHVMITNPHQVFLGDNCVINEYSIIQSSGGAKVFIGDKVTISYGSRIITGGLKFPLDEFRTHEYKYVTIQNGVWLGANAVILPGVTIGENSIIAAGSVITKDVPAFSVFGGVPGKLIKKVNEQNLS